MRLKLILLLILIETFQGPRLDKARWAETSQGDFRRRVIDIQDFRLRLGADTIGSRDDTVKFLGVRTTEKFSIAKPVRISVDLDWNNQANGSYLTAGIVLSPQKTSGNPLNERDWFSMEYIGVPPGQNARPFISQSFRGGRSWLYTEGWPDTNRAGRKIGVQTIVLSIKDRSVEVVENGKLLYDSKSPILTFDEAYLYLQMSSHSNYETREIYFDNVRIEPLK